MSKSKSAEPKAITVRVDPSISQLAARLQAGEIAVISTADFSKSQAAELAAAKPVAVINIANSISGKYPNGGPQVLLAAGIALYDVPLGAVLPVEDGDQVNLLADKIILLAKGDGNEDEANKDYGNKVAGDTDLTVQLLPWTVDAVAQSTKQAEKGLRLQLHSFAANAAHAAGIESETFFEGANVPQLLPKVSGRPVVIVADGFESAKEFKKISGFLAEQKPVFIGISAGANLIRTRTKQPQIVMGNLNVVSEKVLQKSLQRVIHDEFHAESAATRLAALNLNYETTTSSLSAIDLAILAAHNAGASLIVVVGAPVSLVDYLEMGAAGAESSFLTRLVVGEKLLDAKVLANLRQHSFSLWAPIVMFVCAVAALVAAFWLTPGGKELITGLLEKVGLG